MRVHGLSEECSLRGNHLRPKSSMHTFKIPMILGIIFFSILSPFFNPLAVAYVESEETWLIKYLSRGKGPDRECLLTLRPNKTGSLQCRNVNGSWEPRRDDIRWMTRSEYFAGQRGPDNVGGYI